jgi:hypothetical protein
MDESLFLPNNDSGAPIFSSKENNEPMVTDTVLYVETPIKKEYGTRRQPLSELKQTLATPVTSHAGGVVPSARKKIHSGNKHRSNWMIYDNSKIFDR